MSGDPLRDLNCAARIHVFGDSRRTETVTTNSFQKPACLRAFLNQLEDTPTIQASKFNRFTIFAEGREQWKFELPKLLWTRAETRASARSRYTFRR